MHSDSLRKAISDHSSPRGSRQSSRQSPKADHTRARLSASAQLLFSNPCTVESRFPSQLNWIFCYCLLSPSHQTESRLERHCPIDLYDPQPFPAHGLGGLSSISRAPLSNSISPFRQNPSSQTPGPCLSLRNNHGLIILMFQTSHADCTLTRRHISPDFSLAPFSMVRLRHSPPCLCARAHFVRSDRPRNYNHAILPMYGRAI